MSFDQVVQEDAAPRISNGNAVTALPDPPALDPKEISHLSLRKAFVLDTRPGDQFAARHVPGSVCIGLDEDFGTWTRSLIDPHTPVVIVAESSDRMRQARTGLAHVGIVDVLGWLDGGLAARQRADLMTARLAQITVHELHNYLENGWAHVLDVRREEEWQAGHIAGAHWHPLDQFSENLPCVDNSLSLAVHCQSGYRSLIAASLLLRSGETNVINVLGGFDEWEAAGLPIDDSASA